MNDLNRKFDCPIVPAPYRGTVGHLPECGTASGTPCGTKSLKAIADKVLSKPKAGQTVGQSVGQIENCCPTTPEGVGQEVGAVPLSQTQGVGHRDKVPLDPAPRPPEPVDGDWYDDMISMAIEQLNDAGAEYMHASEEDRDRARRLEWEYTEAANAGDSARFWRLLREWKAIWLNKLH